MFKSEYVQIIFRLVLTWIHLHNLDLSSTQNNDNENDYHRISCSSLAKFMNCYLEAFQRIALRLQFKLKWQLVFLICAVIYDR